MSDIFLIGAIRRNSDREAAAVAENIRRRSVRVLKAKLESAELSAKRTRQADICVVVACIKTGKVQLSIRFYIPFFIFGAVPVFPVQKEL